MDQELATARNIDRLLRFGRDVDVDVRIDDASPNYLAPSQATVSLRHHWFVDPTAAHGKGKGDEEQDWHDDNGGEVAPIEGIVRVSSHKKIYPPITIITEFGTICQVMIL